MIRVYGVDHSPWVQAVLLGLHHRETPHAFETIPPLKVFKASGVMMPAASFDGGNNWQLDSADILTSAGFERISDDDMSAIRAAWRGVLHRPDSAWRFFYRFSLAGDRSESWFVRTRNNFLRSFMTLYFFLLIRLSVHRMGYNDPADFGDQFLYWEDKLAKSGGPFLDGESLGMNDLMLFGVMQCHASIPVPPLIAVAVDERLKRLRDWISHMHQEFEGYTHLYSGVYFKPLRSAPVPSDKSQRFAFWAGTCLFAVLFPLTVPYALWLASRVDRS